MHPLEIAVADLDVGTGTILWEQLKQCLVALRNAPGASRIRIKPDMAARLCNRNQKDCVKLDVYCDGLDREKCLTSIGKLSDAALSAYTLDSGRVLIEFILHWPPEMKDRRQPEELAEIGYSYDPEIGPLGSAQAYTWKAGDVIPAPHTWKKHG